MTKEVKIKISINSTEIKSELKKTQQAFNNFSNSTTNNIKKTDLAIGSFVGNITAGLAGRALDGLIAFGKGAIKAAMDMEVLTTQFTVLTGSAEEAEKILKDLSEFATKTPFQLPGLASATKQLIQAKVATEELIPTLRRVGDIAAVTGKPVDELAIAFARIKNEGRVSLIELQKFDDAGAGLLRTMAELEEISISELRKQISAGKIGFEDFERAIDKVTSKGGQFANGMIKQSETLAGKISTMEDSWDAFLRAVGKSNTGFLKTAIESATGFIDYMSSAFTESNRIKIVDPNVKRQLIEIEQELEDLKGILPSTQEGMEKLAKGQGLFGKHQIAAYERFKEVEKEKTAFLKAEADARWEYVTSKTGAKAPGGEGIDSTEEAGFDANELQKRQDALAQIGLTRQEILTEQYENELQILKDAREAELISEEEFLERKRVIADKENALRVKAREDEKKAQKKADKERLEEKKKADADRDKKDKKLKQLKLKGEQNFFNDLAILSRTGSRELFEINKAANMARIVSNIPDTVSSAYKAGSAIGGPPVGSAFAVVAGAAQLALLQQQAQSKPAFANGGVLNAGGTSLTGDQNIARFNDREMFLNMSQQATLFNAIQGGGLGGGLTAELIAEQTEVLREKDFMIELDGITLNKELEDINSRRLS
jgi:predicted acyltransferase (DUF342 family)